MNSILPIILALLYLVMLFGIAYYAEVKSHHGKSIINNGYVYALSLTVYCTAWTYYGSVGRAAISGLDFLPIYLGPTISAFLFIPVFGKIIKICKSQRINSIADFISSRYGKNFSIALIVTVLAVIGIVPYIALQLKAISSSIHVLAPEMQVASGATFWYDDAFYFTIVLVVFIVLFGTRSIDASEKHQGLVAAISFESIVKIVAFIAAGVFIVYGIFNGFGDIFSKAEFNSQLQSLFVIGEKSSFASWFGLMMVSMLSILFLPRQFQVSIVENVSERHLRKATWLFPLYLLLINLFVFPIALAGKIVFTGTSIDADTFVLALPLKFNQPWLSLFVFIGGFSAATSMIIVETIALTTMMSNNLILPILLKIGGHKREQQAMLGKSVKIVRRVSILIILFLAYIYNKTIAGHLSLVSIGLVSFVAVAQFAPAALGGLYWKSGTKSGALAGIISGFVIWFFTLVVPSMVSAGIIGNDIMEHGLFGIKELRPFSLLGVNGLDSIVHAAFWSLFINAILYVVVSVNTKQSQQEILQAEIFVNIDNHIEPREGAVWQGTALLPDITGLLDNFLGEERARRLITNYAQRHKISLETANADPRIVSFVERILSGVIGAASASIMVKSISNESEVRIDEVLNILRESQQIIELNKELRKKSAELQKATSQLTEANRMLREMDERKDEFLYTVPHELRTPVTSLRAMSEILHDTDDMSEEERQQFLHGMIKESERVSHLITQVLNLERYESGRQKLNLSTVVLNDLIAESIERVIGIAKEKGTTINIHIPNTMFLVQCDEALMHQVMNNLLSNAIKFTEKEKGVIDITVFENIKELQVSVSDNGKGIPDEEKELIFDKFFQARNQTLKKPQGSGLGLAICKKIVEMHGGRIWAEKCGVSGARFIFTIPIE